MPPLITPQEALDLGALSDPRDIEALVERAWAARVERFGDSTDMCSLVNAKSGGCAEDCGFCAQSRFAEAETPMHALMEPEQILEHARAAEAAGAHRFCMVTQGQGLSKRDFQKFLDGVRLVAEETNLKRCASIGHMSAERARMLKEAGVQRVHHNVETAESLLPGGLLHRPLRGPAADDRRRQGGRPGDLRRRDPEPRRVARAARRDGLPARRGRPHERPDQPADPEGGDEVRRPAAHGPVGGGQVDRDLPPRAARGAVPPLRRARGEPRRPAAARGPRGRQRRDDGQLPHDARQHARAGPRDVRVPGPEHRAPARQRRQPAAGQPHAASWRARRPTSSRSSSTTTPRAATWTSPCGSGTRRSSCATGPRRRACRSDRTARRTPGPTPSPPRRRPRSASMPDIQQRLDELQDLGLYRRLRVISGPQGPRVVLDGKPVLLLCSNNYLGLADHPRVREAAADAAMRWGVGAGASRLVSGTMRIHKRLEDRLAEFKGAESALLFGSGYLANVGVVSALAGQGRGRLLRRAQPRVDHRRLPPVAGRDVRLPPQRHRAPRLGAASARATAAP